jgi:hypothetical protein
VDFLDFTKLLVRRWWVSLPLLFITLGLTGYVYTSTKPNYTTNAYVVLVPPRPTPVTPNQLPQEQRNVWLQQGLEALANAASITVTEPTAASQMADAGFSSSFTVMLSNSAAMVTFQVTGNSEAQANDTADQLVKVYTDSVKTLQDQVGAAPVDQIQAKRLGATASAVPSNGNVKRAAVAVAGAGLLFTCGVTVAIDALLRRRARRKLQADQADMPMPVAPPAPSMPVSPPIGDPVRSRAAERAEPGVVPTYQSVYSSGSRAANGGVRDTVGATVEDVMAARSRPGAETVHVIPPPPANDTPTDVTVVLPLKLLPGRDSDSGRRP